MRQKVDSKESIDSNLSKSQQQGSKVNNDSKNKQQILINVQFYRNLRVSQPHGDSIKNIHKKWWDDYKLLQKHHGFIQWLFPNSFSSRFNQKSSALTDVQQKIFRADIQIAQNYVSSYQMILQFYGMKLKSKITGQIMRTRQCDFKERYKATLLTSFHNHMRITRILSSLTMIGFGRYAKQLSLFLHGQIHGQNGYLKPLAKYNIDKDWKQYQSYIQKEEDLNIYFKQFSKQQKKRSDKQQEKQIGKQIEPKRKFQLLQKTKKESQK